MYPTSPQNVGGTDRIVRAVLALVLGVLAVGAVLTDRKLLAFVAAAGALSAGINAVTCFCGLNAALGIDTTEE